MNLVNKTGNEEVICKSNKGKVIFNTCSFSNDITYILIIYKWKA